jgi:DNA-binding winged helix-turn-helix (wHTH) protein/Tol biopolymer transport system component
MTAGSGEILAFGPYRIDATQRLLLDEDHIVPLEPKVFDTLLALVRARGRLVTKEELLLQVWADTFVEEGSLTRNISTIRRVLGEGTGPTTYIETVPKRGYRFVAPIRRVSEDVSVTDGALNPTDAAEEIARDLGLPSLGFHPGVASHSTWTRAIVLVVLGVITMALAWSAVAPRPRLTEVRLPLERLTFDVGLTTMPALSPDGLLLAYASDRAGRGDLDIWVQQTTGGTPIRLTDDPADDDSPVFSPDGKQILFRSDRAKPGVYVLPALGGSARFIASEGRRPVFSPDGSRVAYWSGQWRGPASQLPSHTFVMSLTNGTSVRVMSDFAVARDPVWAPDGRALLVLAKRDLTAASDQTLDWWWVPVDGTPAVATRALDLPGLRKAAASAPSDLTLGAWTTSGVIFSMQGNLWLLAMSLSGRIDSPPERLTYGTGPYTEPSAGHDGHLAFSVVEPQRVVERVPLKNSDAPPLRLYADSRSGFERTTQTADGSTIVLERIAADQTREIILKDLASGTERLVIRVGTPNRVSATVSPDGSRIAYTMTPLGESSEGTGFVVDAASGVPRRVCDECQLYGFLYDNYRLVAAARRGTSIRLLDTTSNLATDLVRVAPGRTESVDRPHPSPDARHLAFRMTSGTNQKTFVTPLLMAAPEERDEWRDIDEPTTTGRPTGWSPDSSILYLLLDTDGFRCLWGQRVDASGDLVGKPFLVRHFHRTVGMGFSTGFGNGIAGDTFMYEISSRIGNIWRMRLQDRGTDVTPD